MPPRRRKEPPPSPGKGDEEDPIHNHRKVYIKTETLKVKEEPTRDEDNRNVEVRTGDNREFEENIGEYEPHMEQVYRRREE